MKTVHDEVLLQNFKLCRADLIAAINNSEDPPSLRTMRELADLQLVIMETEGVIAEKACTVTSISDNAGARRIQAVA
jgi:hypothetical protein